MNIDNDVYCNKLRQHSKELIKRDGKSLVDLLLHIHDSTVNLSLIPFCALYCRSVKEFLGVEDLESDTEKEVKDIRNGLKIFTGKYSKGKNMAFNSDYQQNQRFKNMLRFSFLKYFNIHYNLGVYFVETGKIIFNTQLANFYLNIPENQEETEEKHAKMVGEKLGKQISKYLVEYFNISNITIQTTFFNRVPQYGYIDFNTNRKNKFFNKKLDKETNLIFLHILSTIGFINNLFIPIFRNKDEWSMRILYCTVHNTWLAINKIINHLEQNNPDVIKDKMFIKHVQENSMLFSSNFRNCMMHYDLVDRNCTPVILKKWYDPTRPFYGLVESCYDGLTYDLFYDQLYKLSKELEEYLLSYFTVNVKSICWNWD